MKAASGRTPKRPASSAAPSDGILLEVVDHVAWITLSRPEKLNAMRSSDWDSLADAVSRAGADDAVRVVVVRGAGERAFSTGSDLSELAGRSALDAYENALRIQRVCSSFAQLRKPTIAMVHGFALAGGFELALACTSRIAGHGAKFGLPEVSLGMLPGAGGTQRVAHMAPNWVVVRLLLLGETLDSDTALRSGLVDEVVDDSFLTERVAAVAGALVSKDPVVIGLILDSLHIARELKLAAGMAGEAALFGLTVANGSHQAYMKSFLANGGTGEGPIP